MMAKGFGDELLILRGQSGVLDQSEHGHDGTIQGSVSVVTDAATDNSPAFYFVGVTEGYIELPPLGISGSQSRSVFAWAKFTGNYQPTVICLGEPATGKKFTLSAPGGLLRVEIQGSGFTSGLAVTLNTWHLIGVTFGGTTLADCTLHLDGDTQQATGTATLNTTDLAEIGRNNRGATTSNTNMFGYLDDIRVLPRVITGEEKAAWLSQGRGFNVSSSSVARRRRHHLAHRMMTLGHA